MATGNSNATLLPPLNGIWFAIWVVA